MEVNYGIVISIFGITLIVFELFFWTSFILPIGTGLVIAGLIYFACGNPWVATFVFGISLILGYLLSFRYSRKQKGLESILSELYDQTGIVIEKIDGFTYRVRFPLGASGEEVWIAYSKDPLAFGDKVKVTGIKGNKLTVKKI